jgi:hypothetical protein
MTLPRSRRPGLAILGIAALSAAATAVPHDSGAQTADSALTLRAHRAAATTITIEHDVIPQRNPFANDPSVPARVSSAPPNLSSPGAGIDVHLGDAHARGSASDLDNAPRVTATVTGARPFAMIVDAGGSHIVTVGDALAGTTIAAIDAAGVRLRDGAVLTLTTAHDASSARRIEPARAPGAVPAPAAVPLLMPAPLAPPPVPTKGDLRP